MAMVWDRQTKEGLARLIIGGAVNVVLWIVCKPFGPWGGDERELRLLFSGACVGAVALGVVIPVFWRGIPGQAPIALIFAVLPGFLLIAYLSYVFG